MKETKLQDDWTLVTWPSAEDDTVHSPPSVYNADWELDIDVNGDIHIEPLVDTHTGLTVPLHVLDVLRREHTRYVVCNYARSCPLPPACRALGDED